MPEGDFVEDEMWYRENTLAGWGLLFCGFTTFIFALFTRKKVESTGKYALGVLVALVLSMLVSALALELLTTIINAQ